nr:CYTH domain-containing protein [uncultured Flavobacterium sp.]
MLEIERKYKAKNSTFLDDSKVSYKIKQGYLNSSPERTVRIRTKNDKGFITIKGKSDQSGTTRFEWEKEIPYEEALTLLNLCEDFIIEKTRYVINYQEYVFEVDVFEGKNSGLIIVEVELNNENDKVVLPDWVGEEITGDERYYNSYISNHPFENWK